MLQCFFFFFLYNSSSSNNTLRSSRGQENVHNSVWNRAKSSALRTLTYNFFTLSHFRPLADCSWPLGTAITRSKSVYYNRINIYTTLLDIALNSNYKIPTAGNVKKENVAGNVFYDTHELHLIIYRSPSTFRSYRYIIFTVRLMKKNVAWTRSIRNASMKYFISFLGICRQKQMIDEFIINR